MPRGDLTQRQAGQESRAPLAQTGSGVSTSDLHGWVLDWWAGRGGAIGALLRVATIPLEMGFRMVSGAWGRMYDAGMLPLQRAPVPVISVGNLTVGGSGKTPLASWLLKGLRERGETPALVSRGYGQDEILLHRKWAPDTLVIAEEDRAYGAWKAARKGATVVVLDDGFQHRRLARELDIVLLSASTPWQIRLLPRGPFREPFSSLKRAGVVVVTQKGVSEDPLALEGRLDPYLREPPVRVAFVPKGWSKLTGESVSGPEGDYLAVAAIGDPVSFSRVLREATGREGDLLPYPDHHEYSWADVQTFIDLARGRTLVTTEKDAVKLEPYQKQLRDLRVLRLGVEVLAGEERLWRHIEGVLRAGKHDR
jgi:tetraacyldisaccharide 4'-kinase